MCRAGGQICNLPGLTASTSSGISLTSEAAVHLQNQSPKQLDSRCTGQVKGIWMNHPQCLLQHTVSLGASDMDLEVRWWADRGTSMKKKAHKAGSDQELMLLLGRCYLGSSSLLKIEFHIWTFVYFYQLCDMSHNIRAEIGSHLPHDLTVQESPLSLPKLVQVGTE